MFKRLTLTGALLSLSLGCKLKTEGIGAPCDDHRSCESGVCLAAVMHHQLTPWTDGYCTQACGDGCEEGVCAQVNQEQLCLQACQGDEGCRVGYVCEAGVCKPDCTLGRLCDEGLCKPDGRCVPPQPDGAPCEINAECLGGVCLPEAQGWPGGHCASSCAVDGCAEGADCQTLGNDELCLLHCDAQTPCREGYVCGEAWSSCLPDCRLGWDCGALRCDEADGQCRAPDDPPPTLVVGSACVRDEGCDGGICVAEWPLGYCTRACQDDSSCPEAARCLNISQRPMCLARCGGLDGDCRVGYLCNDAQVCVPDCRAAGANCAAPLVCDEASGRCIEQTIQTPNTGAPCASTADCAGFCIPEVTPDGIPTYWPDGYCTQSCLNDAVCGGGSVCRPQPGGALCLQACGLGGGGGCRAGYICEPQLGACLPDCNLGLPCIEGFTCTRQGLCRPAGMGG
ncbi:hypothetical protein KKF91_21015 [Myxococcota bacterium]|nr:hypothetical protein [Myxococcota bacterium]MBU1433025.1 hypothetical protein [Myxococcota bacterium]MBU1899940.1 hypothetical protein [Myxococcota bacterium]